MNMTIVLISRHQAFELLVCLVCSALLLAFSTTITTISCQHVDEIGEAVLQKIEAVESSSDDDLDDVMKNFGLKLERTMKDEMKSLLDEMGPSEPANGEGAKHNRARRQPAKRTRGANEESLSRLREANEAAATDIKTRIEIIADNKGTLPELSLVDKVSSITSLASSRLQQASAYVGSKMTSLGSNVKRRIPPKLRRFFSWPVFAKFKVNFKKKYKSVAEELYRQMIFLHSHVRVGMQHIRFIMGRDRHLNGQNQYSDITGEEYNKMMDNPAAGEDGATLASINKQTAAKLEQLAQSGKNAFGYQVPGASLKSRRKRESGQYDQNYAGAGGHKSQHRRPKRGVDEVEYIDYEDDLAEQDEVDWDNDSNELLGDDYDYDLEDYVLVDEFADDIDDETLSKLDEDLDSALNSKPVSNIDLRETGCLFDPINQGQCGACYSFAINHLASYYNCMDKLGGKARGDIEPAPEEYDPLFIADCGTYMTREETGGKAIRGCTGGYASTAFLFAKTIGVMPSSVYNKDKFGVATKQNEPIDHLGCPYPRPEKLTADGSWIPAGLTKVPVFIKSTFIRLNLDEVGLHLRTVGPILINVRTWRDFKHYRAGIVDHRHEDEFPSIHSMLLVGQARDKHNHPYYIVLNSHGTTWGENGYLRIACDMLEYFVLSYNGIVPDFHD